MKIRPLLLAILILVFLPFGQVAGAEAAERQGVEIWSEGRRLAGDLWRPETFSAGRPDWN